MQPEDIRTKKLQYGKARARTLLRKNAWWLPGFPMHSGKGGVQWQAWPWESPGMLRQVTINREAVRRLEMVLSKLRFHFPRALPKIVDDVDDWLGRMDRLLAILKDAVHDHRPVDVGCLLSDPYVNRRWAERWDRLRKDHPGLQSFVDATVFLEFTSRRGRNLSLPDWIDQHADQLARLPDTLGNLTRLPLVFCTLHEDMDAPLLSFLLTHLVEPAFCATPLGGAHLDYVQKLRAALKDAEASKEFSIPTAPAAATLGDTWGPFLGCLLEQKQKTRRDLTTLVRLLLPGDLAQIASTMRKQVETESTKYLRLLRESAHDRRIPRHRQRHYKKDAKTLVVKWNHEADHTLQCLQFAMKHTLTVSDRPVHLKRWRRFLSCFKEDERFVGLALFRIWETEQNKAYHSTHDAVLRQLQWLLSSLAELFDRRGIHEWLLRHWRSLLRKDNVCNDVVADLLGDDSIPWRRWVKMLEAVLYDCGAKPGPKLLGSLEEFLLVSSDIQRMSRLAAGLAKQEDSYYWRDNIRAALIVLDNDADFNQILSKLDDDYELRELVWLLKDRLHDDRLWRIVRQWVMTARKKPLMRLSLSARMADAVGASVASVPPVATRPDWISRYPSDLRPSLTALLGVSPDAESIAARLLSKEFPDEDSLRRELTSLDQRLASPERLAEVSQEAHLQKRAENLRRRLSEPARVSPQRLKTLSKKIDDRADHEAVERYVHACQDATARALRTRWEGYSLPETLFEPPHDQLLSGILALKGPMKELGLRVLTKLGKDACYDFRNEPANAAFLEKIERKGIRLGPWLDDHLERTAITAKGETYRLAFTRDLVDVLLMGFHFDTCLSPHNVNFFSAVANAVDVNKQVVYGKTSSGRIVGRCLFALADTSAILTYARYAHNPRDQFDKEVAAFAQQLADKMNTIIASQGKVSTLVARDLYDDGVVACGAAYDLHDADGAVRTALRTASPQQLVESLRMCLGSERLLREILGDLLLVEEFQRRPAIVGPLVTQFASDPTIEFPTRLRLAVLAYRAGDKAAAERIVRSLRINTFPERLKRFNNPYIVSFPSIGSHEEVFDLLIACNPSIALRAFRSTRPRGVKSDAEEKDENRRNVLAKCQNALGRAEC
ncbi:MAG: hypothetical protein JW818_04965 [Pirellulales bacterium]|nr:hypothetical protein [Pirellulales bacterium]